MESGDTSEAPKIEVRVLGWLEVVVGGEVCALRPAQRRVIATLALDAGRGRSTDELIDRFWVGDPPRNARTALHVHMSGIRRVVPGLLAVHGGRYRIAPEVSVDRTLFEDAARDALLAVQAGDWSKAHDSAALALRLWRGEPYVDISDGAHAGPDVARLGELRLLVFEAWAEASLALHRPESVVPELRAILGEHPMRERSSELLMRALYRSGLQSEALREYQRIRTALDETMGIEPCAALRTLERRMLQHDPALGGEVARRAGTNVPLPVTSFVGRRAELAELAARIGEQRLITLTGAPGSGKTRLAIELARSLDSGFPAGVWFVELAGVRTEAAVAATIASTVGLSEQVATVEQVAVAIRLHPMLVILDNCEHVLEPVRRFCLGVVAAPGPSRIVATSREPITAAGESTHPLRPLAPDTDGAVGLLTDRIREFDRGFRVTPQNRSDLVAVCERVGGLPLALELIARWVPTLGTSDLSSLMDLVQADTDFERAYLWSTGLLPEVDRGLLRELTVFAGSFSLTRAREVCGDVRDELAVAGGVSRLLAASLLELEWSDDGTARYRLLGPIRELSSASLERRRQRLLAGRHAETMIAAARRAGEVAATVAQASEFAVVDRDLPDHRAAMEHLRGEGDFHGVAAIAAALGPYWYGRLLAWEGRAWLQEALAHELDNADLARVLDAAAFLAWATHDYEAADAGYRRSLEIGRATGDRRVEATALFGLGTIHQKRRFEDGAAMLMEAAAIFEALEDCEVELGQCLMFRGLDEAYNGDVAAAEDLLVRASSLLAAAGHLRQVSKSRRWLAHCAWRRGCEDEARTLARSAEELARATSDRLALSGALIEQAYVSMTWGELSNAAEQLLEALDPVPEHDEIDACQVLLPIARLAAIAGEPQAASAILAHVDGVYHRHGWRPPDASPAVRQLRAALVGSPWQPGDAMATASSLLQHLATPATAVDRRLVLPPPDT